MNEYKITYVAGEGETEQAYITERTEAAARKFFKKAAAGREIVEVELYKTDAPATKEQERETLEKIRAMVAELGPDSYLKTAFDGAFADAEQNIEDDAAFSYKARFELADTQRREAESVVNSLREDLTRAELDIELLRVELDTARKHIIPEELRRDLFEMTTAEAQASRARMAEAADKMAVCAENPGCVLFKDSVARYRAEKARAEAMEQRAAELDAMEPKNN